MSLSVKHYSFSNKLSFCHYSGSCLNPFLLKVKDPLSMDVGFETPLGEMYLILHHKQKFNFTIHCSVIHGQT